MAINPIALFASHLIGGKITYRYLGANKYEIKLSVYRDCSDQIDFDDPAYVSIYSKVNNSLVYNNGLSLLNRSMIPALPPDPCFVPPPGICVELGEYIDTVQLLPNNAGYAITYQRCCRNISVFNIVNPAQNGITITSDIPPVINNTPQFVQVPPIYICQSDTFNYSFAATDADGDNLVYQLCTPLTGLTNLPGQPNPAAPPPYPPVFWSQGYSQGNQISNTGGMTLNSSTGQLKFKPNFTGQYAFSICVLEYRNNTLINTNQLEMQFNVVNCYLVSSIPTATNLCEGLSIDFQNSSSNANAFHWDFGVPGVSADTSNLFAPTYIFPAYGTYTVSLVVFNTSYGFCKDTTTKIINVNPLLSPTLQSSYTSCYKNNSLSFNVGGSYHTSATFNWDFTPNSNTPNVSANPVTVHFTSASTKTVSVLIDQFGCKDTLFATVTFSNPVAAVNSANLNCNERNLSFGNFSTGATGFQWDFGVPAVATDTSSLSSPGYTYQAYGIYTITLIVSDGVCSDTLREKINVFPKLALNPYQPLAPQCFKNNRFDFFANGVYGSGVSFSWLFDSTASVVSSGLENPAGIHFNQPGNHLVRFTISENGCTKQRTQAVKVHADPVIQLSLSDSTVCEPATIRFRNTEDPLHPLSHKWTINDSLFSDTAVYYNFPHAGVYSFSLVVQDANNCTDTVRRSNRILVHPTPKIRSFVNPLYASVLSPEITFIDSTAGNFHTWYDFGDGATSFEKHNAHSYQDPGEFPYTLVAYSDFGCADTAAGVMFIDDIGMDYVPNIFTPNGDDVNENFFIKGESITNSNMQIFNRWGGLVFQTNDALKGWNGIERSTGAPCSDGTYLYIISVTLNNTRKYTFNGTVQLQR